MLTRNSSVSYTHSKIRDIAISGLLIALVFISTMFIQIRLPISINGGLVHAGTAMLFTVAFVFGRKKAAIAGAFGMGLFDIVSGWAPWAPFTFIVRGIMGYLAASISNTKGKKGSNFLFNLFAIILSGVWMLVGYYFTEVILYGNWAAPFTSIPGNSLQLLIGLLSLVLTPALKKIRFFSDLHD
jgi:uncharacterized membrane protein